MSSKYGAYKTVFVEFLLKNSWNNKRNMSKYSKRLKKWYATNTNNFLKFILPSSWKQEKLLHINKMES